MKHVLFNYVVDGVVVDGPMSYLTVLERTGLKDAVGLTALGYLEDFPNSVSFEVPSELVYIALRTVRNDLLQRSDWTQMGDVRLSDNFKALWATYRDDLRVLPGKYPGLVSLGDVVWPKSPNEFATSGSTFAS